LDAVVTVSSLVRADLEDAEAFLDTIAGALRLRPEPLDMDASVLAEVGIEMAQAHKSQSDWPHGVVSRGKVLGWAHRVLSVVHHLHETVGTELEATQQALRVLALRLQGHAEGLRSTGQWPVQEAVPVEVDPDAPTEPYMRKLPRR
jgi:hypothetical protein